MNFASLQFWTVLIVTFACLVLARRFLVRNGSASYDQISLLLLSLILLGSESLLSALIFLYVAALGIIAVSRGWAKGRTGVILCVSFLVLPLVYFKYSDFILGGDATVWKGIIPMGISFYTFQAIAMVVDHRSKPLPDSPFKLLNFLCFFPQIVAGPIERSKDLLPQIALFEMRIRWERFLKGLSWIITGLFFKLVLADNLASSLRTLHTDAEQPISTFLQILGLGFRIYFDFSGYSFIALGLAILLGVNLTLNFRSPYLATTLQEFWSRWHITLSTWIRDYLYIPLGGGRTRYWPVVVVFVFVVSGLWHGAGLNFLIWGGIHGVCLVFWRLWTRISGVESQTSRFRSVRKLGGWALTQTVVFVAWLPFFISDISVCFDSIVGLFQFSKYGALSIASLFSIFDSRGDFLVFFILLLMSLVVVFLEFLSKILKNEDYHYFSKPWVQLLMIFLTIVLGSVSDGEFVYFNF